MSKHNPFPGPWKFEPGPFGSFRIIAKVDGNVVMVARRSEICHFAEQSHANGRLSAAAPDLLEATKQLLRIVENHGGCCCTLELPCIRCMARAAIAKAEEET